jgi:hypothetical protein
MNGWTVLPVTDAHIDNIDAVFDGPVQARYNIVQISSRVSIKNFDGIEFYRRG